MDKVAWEGSVSKEKMLQMWSSGQLELELTALWADTISTWGVHGSGSNLWSWQLRISSLA